MNKANRAICYLLTLIFMTTPQLAAGEPTTRRIYISFEDELDPFKESKTKEDTSSIDGNCIGCGATSDGAAGDSDNSEYQKGEWTGDHYGESGRSRQGDHALTDKEKEEIYFQRLNQELNVKIDEAYKYSDQNLDKAQADLNPNNMQFDLHASKNEEVFASIKSQAGGQEYMLPAYDLELSRLQSVMYQSSRAEDLNQVRNRFLKIHTNLSVQQYNAKKVGLGALEQSDKSFRENDHESGEMFLSVAGHLADFATDFLPATSIPKDIYRLTTGKDPLTGETLGSLELSFAAFGLVTVGHSNILTKGLGKLGNVAKLLGKDLKLFEAAMRALPSIKEVAYKVGLDSKGAIRDFVQFTKRTFGNEVGAVGKVDSLIDANLKFGWHFGPAVRSDIGQISEALGKSGRLPDNFITKEQARGFGWSPGKDLNEFAPGKSIGGDLYRNLDSQLPNVPGRQYFEADLGFRGGKRGPSRMIFSNDGKLYITNDHYQNFIEVK